MTGRGRIIVVGAGVIGAAIAFRLSMAGRQVLVVDAEGPAAGASGRSFGWINANFYADAHHFHLRVAAMEAFHALETDLGPTGVTWPGAISWEVAGDALDAMTAALAEIGYPHRRITRVEFSRLEPGVADAPEEALYFPTEGVVDLADLTRRLLSGAARHGARFCFGLPGTSIQLRGGRVSGLQTPDGVLEADRIVVAAGIGSAALVSDLGVALPMLRRPALLLRTNPVAPIIRHVLASPEQELRQEPDGRILAPTSASHQSDAASDIADTPEVLAEAALKRLRAILPAADLHWENVVRAFRPVPGDGLPVVGATAVEGLYLAVMHSGATLAALIGSLAAEELAGGPEAPLLAPYRPARFG